MANHLCIVDNMTLPSLACNNTCQIASNRGQSLIGRSGASIIISVVRTRMSWIELTMGVSRKASAPVEKLDFFRVPFSEPGSLQ